MLVQSSESIPGPEGAHPGCEGPVPELTSVAFHLPQFHPIPENDRWWGPGFTEWRNVAQARPVFRGHYQPHVPADLGYYDLRVNETRIQQAELAREYGVGGFCYYHYWFNGRRVLERPVEEMLASGIPDFPYMLCWANENWTRRWDGADHEVLLKQSYNKADDRQHIAYLAEFFTDSRYIRVDGKPVFLVYRASEIPDVRRTLDTWREEASRLGVGELFLCRVEAHAPDHGDPRALGFDSGVEFQPDIASFPPAIDLPVWGRALRRAFRPRSGYRLHSVFEYERLMRTAMAKSVDYPRFRCVTPGFDNSARRAVWATIFRGARPELFEEWTRAAAESSIQKESTLLFVNAWNEWAEGNHLEPDLRYGHAWLEAHHRGLGVARSSAEPRSS